MTCDLFFVSALLRVLFQLVWRVGLHHHCALRHAFDVDEEVEAPALFDAQQEANTLLPLKPNDANIRPDSRTRNDSLKGASSMSKQKKATATKRRAKVRDMKPKEKDLTVKEAKAVKGGETGGKSKLDIFHYTNPVIG
jgi:hypothetical protein